MKNEVKIGIFAAVAIISLILGFNFLKGKDIFEKSFSYTLVFKEAPGLQKATPVYFRGFKVGSVKSLMFDDEKSGMIFARIDVKYDLHLKKGSLAYISSTDLLGSKGVVLQNPTENNPMLAEGDTIQGEIEPSLTESLGPLKNKTEVLMSRIDTLVYNLNRLTDPGNRNSIASTLKHTENMSAQLDQLVERESQRLDNILASVESITKNLKNNNELINKILANAATLSDSLAQSNLKSTIAAAKSALEETSGIMKKINKGEGSLGQLVNNQDLYKNLTNSAKSLDNLLIDLKENPGEYIHFSVFGRKKKQKSGQ